MHVCKNNSYVLITKKFDMYKLLTKKIYKIAQKLNKNEDY